MTLTVETAEGGGGPAVNPGDGHPMPRAAGPTVWLQSPGGGTSVS